MPKTLINICGNGRSGSTMLDLMLGAGNKSFSLGEVYAFYRPWRKHHFSIKCACGDDQCKYWENLSQFCESDFHANAFDILGVDYIIDSSKNLNWIIDNNIWARKNNIKIFNILLYKTPISYIHSIWKRGGSIEKAIETYINYQDRFFELKLPHVSVNYHELVRNDTSILRNICDIVGLDYTSNNKQFWNEQSHQLFGSSGTTNQNKSKKSIVHTEEHFNKGFSELIPTLENKLSKNRKIRKILELQNINDIRHGYKNNDFSVTKPYWYYTNNMKSMIRKIFPENVEELKL